LEILINDFNDFNIDSRFFSCWVPRWIEYGVIDELSSCKTEISKNISKDILLKELQSKLAPSCKQVDFKLFGMSLALINMIMSLIFAILYYKMFSWIKKTSK